MGYAASCGRCLDLTMESKKEGRGEPWEQGIWLEGCNEIGAECKECRKDVKRLKIELWRGGWAVDKRLA